MLALIEKIAATHNIPIATIAHAGDGNLHPCLVTPKGDLDGRDRALAAFQAIIDAAIDMGGTVTGEHGVGLLKRGGMRQELSPGVLAMQVAVKRTLDPLGLFNPGKVIG